MTPILSQQLAGGLGNCMFEHLLARAILRRIPEMQLTGKSLLQWGIHLPSLPLPARHVKVAGNRVELERLAYLVRSGLVQGIETTALGMRMEYLGEVAAARQVFRSPSTQPLRFPEGSLVISVRGAEILGGVHKDYRPVPIALYRRLVAETGLSPVFLGQLGEDAYSQALRAQFPAATFVPSQGPMEDFAALRAARHLVASVSTFSWLACWLSEAETIHLPILGMYHPRRRADIDLLPLTDPRYRFHLLPHDVWTGSAAEMAAVLEGTESGMPIGPDALLPLAQPSVAVAA
ncbi:hypothetical protein ACLF3G_18935 [Falsiroseomonas sp. HC035]|uniref:hypothetical protein n=1 Tax=Falsiroseomonas sp. HC035 TaxID=3390999 RepID=UPI003D313254